MRKIVAAVASTLFLSAAASVASAGQGDGIRVVDSNAEIVLSYVDGGGAGNTNLLFLFSPFESVQIFSNKAQENLPFSLGTLAQGTELVFRLNSDGTNWYSGPLNINSDGFAHAIVTQLANDTVEVAFEDLPGGGDRNFRDMVFQVTNAAVVAAPVPEPEAYALMLAGLGFVAWGVRRRASRASFA